VPREISIGVPVCDRRRLAAIRHVKAQAALTPSNWPSGTVPRRDVGTRATWLPGRDPARDDSVVTKMAALIRALVRNRAALEAAAGGKVRCRLHGWHDPHELVMEGGQGLLPTHTKQRIQERCRQAAYRGACEYLRLIGRNPEAADSCR
jgi:hypothetical protein